MQLIISASARNELRAIIAGIREQSPQNAEGVLDAVLKKMQSLLLFPKKFPVYPFVPDNQKQYRSVTVKNIRIIYREETKRLIIVAVMHSRSNPENLSWLGKKD